jgi:hypothetical protein
MLLFLDGQRTQSLWYLLKREGKRDISKEHLYVKGQPGDLALGKLKSMVFELADLEKGEPGVLEVANKLKDALDVEQLTKRFFTDFKKIREDFANYISNIDDERDQRWYVSVLLNRLMFIYFLQRKFFLDNGDIWYLQKKMDEVQENVGPDRYYDTFLRLLFFEGFAVPREEWSEEARKLLGNIRYLNGGLFLKHRIEQDWPDITIPDEAFTKLFELFQQYTWNLDDTPGGNDNELRPHVLGYIFEKYINQKAFGAYYTLPEITDYLCERTIYEYILQRLNASLSSQVRSYPHFDNWADVVVNLDAHMCRELLDMLPKIRILDPACGSGAFLVSALNTLVNVYGSIIGKIEMLHDPYLTDWLANARAERGSLNYAIRKKIITENLFGVDLMEEAMEIAKLRLFITLVSSVEVEQLEPLPNIDFNILPGNSLIGFLRVDEQHVKQLGLFFPGFDRVIATKNINIAAYRSATRHGDDLRTMRNLIEQQRKDDNANLNQLLLDDFTGMKIKCEEATWDAEREAPGKTTRRSLRVEDIAKLHPFHWGYEFDRVMVVGGFDIIIANPPWEALKPLAKEFFSLYEKTISKNKMRIEDFEQEQTRLLQNEETRGKWLDYQNAFPHQSAYFRTTPQYTNQIALVNGRKQGTDINLYKLFVEQCYNLLRDGGLCGLVVPSGLYTDLGTKQLREMLFDSTRVTGLFGFENRKTIFEGVDSRFKFVVLTYLKGEQTSEFSAAFMRHEVSELSSFPQQAGQKMTVDLIRQLSPASLSIMELKNELDVTIVKKMQAYPLLGEKLSDTWNLSLSREFDMTNDHRLFKSDPGPDRLPLYEGKMIHQFTHTLRSPRYWVDEREGRSAILGRKAETGQLLGYQRYRLGFRDIARNTDQRTFISTLIPPAFHGNKIPTVELVDGAGNDLISEPQQLFLCALWNSFTVDWLVRLKVTATLNFFHIYQLPIPRLTAKVTVFRLIVQRAARLVCTTPEFADLWAEVLPGTSWSPSVAASDAGERARLRAEIDGLVAHLYGLSEEEFAYVLSMFPLVEQEVKDAALQAYWDFALSEGNL